MPLQMQAGAGSLKVSLAPCPAPDLLAREWRVLEAQARPSFFTSWPWIRCWLVHLAHLADLAPLEAGPRPGLVRVHRGPELVGLGVVVPHRTRRLRWWPSQALHLHATGEAVLDDITIEHNGWLARADMAAQVGDAVAAQLWALAPGVDQIRLPGVAAGPERWHALADPAPAPATAPALAPAPATAFAPALPPALPIDESGAPEAGSGPGVPDAPKVPERGEMPEVREVREHTEPAYRVDLAQVRASGQAYLDRLGAPTRSSIRRSLRLYESRGPVRLEVAATVDEGLRYLARLKHFHQAAWQARGRPGAFANPRFEGFHQRLVRTGLPIGQVQLLRLTAGPDEVGYLYNFVHGGQVLAYQSGFHFGLTERNHHPGLVTHALAVQQALEAGCEGYDFLAGEARHKQQLASHCYPMTTVTLHRASVGWWLERAWRSWRGRA